MRVQVVLIRVRYCEHGEAGDWDIAIKKVNCGKGRMMAFLRWICEEYIAKKRKARERKSVNQYWRDFKMLYRRQHFFSGKTPAPSYARSPIS